MATTLVLDRYGRRFSEQGQRNQRSVEVVSNPIVDEICQRYEKWAESEAVKLPNIGWDELYNHGLDEIQGLSYTPNDITEFSLRLNKYDREKEFASSGFFLSALINSSEAQEFEIVTEHLKRTIDWIGYLNTKNIFVEGNIGHFIGVYNNSGSIVINGNVKDDVGYSMRNGLIVVKGDARNFIGNQMTGGIIKIEGNSGSIAIGICPPAQLYHKGKLIRGGEW